MGKQINFYLDEETEQKFVDFVTSNGGEVLFEDETSKPVKITTLHKPFSCKGWFKLHLYKTVFGDLTLEEFNVNRYFINSSKVPVIEFIRTAIDEDKKEIRRGRLWLEMKYWNEKEELVEKPKELDKWYGTLNRWIKKNVIKLEKVMNGHKYIYYVSPTLMELIDNDYKLR